MKIEHWAPRNPDLGTSSENADHQFLWSNLLGVSLGVSSESSDKQEGRNISHCDTSRGNADLFLHPVEGQGPDPRVHLRYTKDGRMKAETPDDRVDRDIQVLNLNAPSLVRAREAVLDEAWKRLKRPNFAIGELHRLEQQLHIVADIKAREHTEFLRYHVSKKIRSLGHSP